MHPSPRHRRALLILALCVLGCLLCTAIAWAQSRPAASSPPTWAWVVAGSLVLILLGVCGFFARRYIERRDKREEQECAERKEIDRRLDSIERTLERIDERIAGLPCRHSPGGNSVPPVPGPLCSTRDREPST